MDNEVPLFQLPVPPVLTQNMEGVDDSINYAGIDRIDGSSGGGAADDPSWQEQPFWVVEDSGGVNVPSEYIFKVKAV